MTKNGFLDIAVRSVLEQCPAWDRAFEDRRRYLHVIARTLPGHVTLFLDLSIGPSTYYFGYGVGWTRDEDSLKAMFMRRENPPHRLRDGSLARLRKLSHPRDFTHDEMSVSVSSLVPRLGIALNLEKVPEEKALATMRTEVRDFALPYLYMMLRARHAIDISQQELAVGYRQEGAATTQPGRS